MPPDLEPASAFASLTLRFLGKEREFRLYNDGLLYREYQCVLPGGCVYLTEWKGQLGTGAFAARFANKPGSGSDEQSALSALERALVPLADDLSCLIEADRAAVREASIREAIEVVERWTWGTVNEMDTGKRRTLEALRKLLTEKVPHG